LIDAVQVIYNIFDQTLKSDLSPTAWKRGLVVIAVCLFDEGTPDRHHDQRTNKIFLPMNWRASYFVPETSIPASNMPMR